VVGRFTQRYKQNRDAALDILRGIAVLLVICFHDPIPAQLAGWLRPIAVPLCAFGWTGVDLFFVLSGFLVAGLLFKELIKRNTLDVKRFIFRRGLKIWPGYYAYLAFAAICLLKTNHTLHDTFMGIAPNLLHVQNYFPHVMVLTFTWSLAVEEHFYLFLPLVLALLLRFSKDRFDYRPCIAGLAVSIMLICPILRLIDYEQHPNPDPFRLMATHLHIDGIAFGALLAYVYHFKPQVFKSLIHYRAALMLTSLLLVSPFFVHTLADNCFFYTFGTTLLSLGFGCLLISLMYVEPGVGKLGQLIQLAPFRAISFIGFYSYSIYLWHFTCREVPYQFLYLIPWIPRTLCWFLQLLLYIGCAILLGYLAARCIELPALALRERLPATRTSSDQANPLTK